MKTRFLNKMAGLLAVLLLFSCTGKFEEYNTDNTGFTDEQKTYDYNTFGVWLKVVQMGIYFNYDWQELAFPDDAKSERGYVFRLYA